MLELITFLALICLVVTWLVLLVLALHTRNKVVTKFKIASRRVSAAPDGAVPLELDYAVQFTLYELLKLQRVCVLLSLGLCKPVVTEDGRKV